MNLETHKKGRSRRVDKDGEVAAKEMRNGGIKRCGRRSHKPLARLYLLVPEANVLRFEDLSVGHFPAGDDVQLVDGLHHSPARQREGP